MTVATDCAAGDCSPSLPTTYQRRNADIVRWHDQLPIGGAKAPSVIAGIFVPHDDQDAPNADAFLDLSDFSGGLR